MGGTRWNDFDTALLLYLVAEPFIHLTHSECAQILTKQTRRRRSMVAVRSKLGELRKDSKNSSLFQEDLHMWCQTAVYQFVRENLSLSENEVNEIRNITKEEATARKHAQNEGTTHLPRESSPCAISQSCSRH